MKLIKSIYEMQKISAEATKAGKTIAVVPTMGYLHTGHTSLITKAKELADVVITTLFVNPAQFAPNEDFDKYPRDFDHDFKLAAEYGSDYLFNPDRDEMYPEGYDTYINISGVTAKLEGSFRPDHFRGVATVVAKLFNATQPDFAIFGQKDYQQTLVIKQLVRDLNFNIQIVVAPTVRETDGLAMSSRNVYLSPDERKSAVILFQAMNLASQALKQGELCREVINSIMKDHLKTLESIRIDYALACDALNLDEPEYFAHGQQIVLLIACYHGKTRLIDNMLLTIT